ncbi:hypothetical protein [Burkholderia vietnamiensis]|uniref:hypothetical protein n=1 Tax=Burkholderia vietnamiensis TaxID=60552 RepID=UPI001CF43C59|nr:hypothetical protein [Burkholderia vietnamiensis]MCA8448856.1 hypothetical protein [Burkholderia vietnamiensis]
MSNDTQVLDPEMAAMLNSLDDDAVGVPATTESEDDVLHAEPIEPVEPTEPDLPVEGPAVAEVVAHAGDAEPARRPGMTPAIEDLMRKRTLLIAAAKTVSKTINGTDGQSGVAKVVRKMNAGLDGARVVLGSSFGTPKETLERLMEGHVIESITPSMFRDLLSGKAFEFPVLEELKSQVDGMRTLHQAWCAAIRIAAPDVQACRREKMNDPTIIRVLEEPSDFVAANNGDIALTRDLRVLRAEIAALGAFAEAYAQALDGDWSAVDAWIRNHKAPFAKAIAQADAAMEAAMMDEQDEQDEAEPQAADVEPEVVVEIPPSDDDVILSALDLDDVDTVADKPRDVGMLPSASGQRPTFVDRETGEIIEPIIDEVSHPVVLAKDAERASAGAPAFQDEDPMEDHSPALPPRPVTHATDDVVPVVPRDVEPGRNLVALAQKHFYALAGGAAVLVLGVAFWVGHAHRHPSVPVAAPVLAPVAQPAPASTPVPASVPSVASASAPASAVGTPAASAPMVTKPVVSPVHTPAPAAPVKPAAAEHVAKPEVHKPARPVVHEHVTTLRETNQALDQLREKLGD